MKTQTRLESVWTRFLERSFNILVPVLAILGALLISGLLIAAYGANALAAYAALFSGAFGSPAAWATTLARTIPLVFTGLAVTYGYRGGFFNVGVEGQLFMGGLAGAWVALTFADWPGWLLIPASMLGAAVAGALLAAIPGILKATRNTNEVLTSILLNYIVLQFFELSLYTEKITKGVERTWTLANWFGIKDPTQALPKSASMPAAANLPSVADLLRSAPISGLFAGQAWYKNLLDIPAFGRITLGVVLALIAAFLVYVLLFRMATGFRVRAVGINPETARRTGVNVRATIISTAMISGALAGLAGGVDMLGSAHRVVSGFLAGAGWTGIPVALIGQLHPGGVVLSALFFGALRSGANKMQVISQVPMAVVGIIQALAILFAIAGTVVDIPSRIRKARVLEYSQGHTDVPGTAQEAPHA